jgi:16S rRNA (adenine1518-N6/adenine1519-N6)-dimethyltransferase
MTTLPSAARRPSPSSLLLLILCTALAVRPCSSFGSSSMSSSSVQGQQRHRQEPSRTRRRRHDGDGVNAGGGERRSIVVVDGWVQRPSDGEWTWEEDDGRVTPVASSSASVVAVANANADPLVARATPTLPSGTFRPKQSLGQNFLRDGNTVAKIVRAFVSDANDDDRGADCANGDPEGGERRRGRKLLRCVELGPGAGALTDVLVPTLLESADLRCIEIDNRSVELLRGKHPTLEVIHQDVLRVDYRALASDGDYHDENENENDDEDGDDDGEDGTKNVGRRSSRRRFHPTGTTTTTPLSIIGNLPYYITSQILFALADASHSDSVKSATVTMQYEVGRRLVASTSTKDYGILSVVFQLYCTSVRMHFKIPPTVFYPQPKVDSALMGLHFAGSELLRRRLGGVHPRDLRSVVTTAFRQRRKTVRNGLRRLATEVYGGDADRASDFLNGVPGPLPACVRGLRDEGDVVASNQELPDDWAGRRPEELTPGQFVEITRMLYGPAAVDVDEEGGDGGKDGVELGNKVWRKLKHGSD